MKKILSILLIACTLWGCEDFLDSENKTKKDTENYPRTPRDASQLLTGVYSILARPEPLGTAFMSSELMSDNLFGGGGRVDTWARAMDQFKKVSDDSFRNPWRAHYFGVFRSNFLISRLNDIAWENEEQRNQLEGEVHYLRAHFYFDLSRMFGEVPLLKTPEPLNLPQAPAAETYALIASDLKKAIEKLPDTPFGEMNKEESGRVTKWAAQALMARVFLFYTGYYQKATLPLEGGEEINKAQATAWLIDCIENSGHDLVDDFRNLWPYAVAKDYKYTKDNNLTWAGDGNKETVFAIKYSHLADDDHPQQKSNQIALYWGVRHQEDARINPFGIGWGMGTVNPKLWNDWPDEDLRKKGSIINVKDRNEMARYVNGSRESGDLNRDETLFMQKKYIPINLRTEQGGLVNYSCVLYGNKVTDFKYNNTQDLVLMRFSDVLLMAAELGAPNAQHYLDKVRTRAGLNSVPPTLDNIKNERRFELAFEAVRYYDLLRWHDWDVITDNQTDIDVYNEQRPEKKNIVFRPETGGFLQIPRTEIEMSNGVLKPNPGWEGPENFLEE